MAKKPIIRYFDRGVWYDATVSDIGNLEDLNTVHKTTVVEAINDIVGGNFAISGNLLDRLNELDESIAGLDEMITGGTLNENQAEKINQFVVEKLNELNQSMEELNKQREQRLKEQEEKVAQLKLDSESDKQRIEEITEDLNATKEKLNNAELNVTSVTQIVDEINGKISQAVSKTDFDLLEGTVREQKTLIDQTAEGIKLLATKEELDKANENVKSIKSEIDVQAELIESKVSSEQLINEMEKIDKYMPNLLRYTRNWQDWENDDEANVDVTLNEYRDCVIQRARGIGKGLSTTVEDLEIGETYSLSVWVKHDDTNAKLYAMVDNEEIIMTDLNSEETFVGNEFKRMRCSFVAQDTTAKVRFIFKDCRTDSYGYLAGAKCEKNKKVSGWQPNSEDVYQSIKSARSEIKQTDDKITTLVGTVTKQGDLISSNTTSIEETDKAIKLQAESIKTLNESIESTKAELKVNSDAITSKVWKTDVGEMISDINIDNKNRVLNSDFGDEWELWSETNNLFQLKKIGNYRFAVAERSGLPQNMAIAIATNKFPVKHNERLMFGFYFYCADLSKLDNKIVGALELLDINDIRIDRVDFDVSKLSLKNGSFTKLSDTYFVEDERIVKARLRFFLNRNGNVGFALPMAQGGDIKSSEWSLAPEDVARRFNDTNIAISNYEQTVNGFKQTVESYKGSVDGYSNQVSEFNQTVNGFNQTVKDYKESNDKRVEQIESSLTTQSGKIEAVVKESAGTKDELGKLTADGGRISKLEVSAQGISSTVGEVSKKVTETNERIDNINIGSDNLLEKTDTSIYDIGNWKSNGSSLSLDNNVTYQGRPTIKVDFTNNNGGIGTLGKPIILKPDTEYYYSAVIKTNKDYNISETTPLHMWLNSTTDAGIHMEISLGVTPEKLTANKWTTAVRKFKTPTGSDKFYMWALVYGMSGLVVNVADVQVREGNQFIPWSPSSKDSQSQIDSINKNLREKYMTIEQSNSWIEQKKDSIVQGVSDRVEEFGRRVENIKIGGRNLIWHSKVDEIISSENKTWWYFTTSDKNIYQESFSKDWNYISIKSGVDNEVNFGQWQQDQKIFGNSDIMRFSVGDIITIGFDVWIDDNTSGGRLGVDFRVNSKTNYNDYFSISKDLSPQDIKPKVWQRIYFIGEITQKYVNNINDLQLARIILYRNTSKKTNEVRFKKIKIEKGNTATDWSPHPDDAIKTIGGENLIGDFDFKNENNAKWNKENYSFICTSSGNTNKDATKLQLQIFYNDKTQGYSDYQTIENGYFISRFKVEKPFNDIRIKINGNTQDGGVYFKGSKLEVGGSYVFSCMIYGFDINKYGNGTTISNIMVQRGSEPTSFQKSPYDIESNLEKNYYTKTEVNSAISTSKEGIVLGYQKAIENISIGGENLLRNTYFTDGASKHDYWDGSNITILTNDRPSGVSTLANTIRFKGSGGNPQASEGINSAPFVKSGKDYTVSFWAKADKNTELAVESNGVRYYQPITTSWAKYSGKVTFQSDNRPLYFYARTDTSTTFYLNSIKLEEGLYATSHSLSSFDSLSNIVNTNNNLANNYYNKQTVDSMLQVDGQGIKTYVKSTKSQLDNLSVGGRNLLFETGYFGDKQFSGIVGDSSKINLYKGTISDANSPSGKAYRVNKYKKGTENVNGGCYWQMPKKLTAGKKYTWSVYVRGSGTIGTFGPEQGGAKSVTLTSNWTKISHTFTANSNQYYQFTFYSTPEFDLYFTDLMLEEGTTPSPWRPAPEDYENKIDGVSGNVDSLSEVLDKINTWKTETAESFIEQTANSLSTLIKDKNGASLMHFDSTSSTWSFNTSTLEKNISDAKTAGNNAQSTANSANDLANKLNNAIKDIQNKTAYITMTTYQGKPCIELGKTDNKFKVRITNESVDFLDGSTRVAYVSNNQLYIEKAIVKNEFQIGEGTGFVWKKRSNGNMGLRWGG